MTLDRGLPTLQPIVGGASYASQDSLVDHYLRWVEGALQELRGLGFLSPSDRLSTFSSAVRAYLESH